MKTPTVDVVIPVYNGEAFVGFAIDSALRQTYLPVKIIVVDDGSTDGTRKAVAKFKGTKPKVIYVKKKNGGPSSARNAGISRCKSDFVALLDADDVWEKTKLQKQIALFKTSKEKNLGVVYCDYGNIDEEGRPLVNFSCFKLDRSLRGNVYQELLSGNKIAGSDSAVLVRRECFRVVGGFDEKLITSEDWDLWLRIARRYSFDYVPEKLVMLRRHHKSLQRDPLSMLTGGTIFMSKRIEEGSLTGGALKSGRYRLLREIVNEFPHIRKTRLILGSLSPEAKRILFSNRIYVLRCVLMIIYDRVSNFLLAGVGGIVKYLAGKS